MMKYVYFLKPIGEIGPIKIGASKNPVARLRSYQIWSPMPLEIVGQTLAHWTTERWLHRHFLSDWLHGEWFEWSEKLQSVIDHANQSGCMPDWVTPPTNPTEFRQFIETYPKGKTKGVINPRAGSVQ